MKHQLNSYTCDCQCILSAVLYAVKLTSSPGSSQIEHVLHSKHCHLYCLAALAVFKFICRHDGCTTIKVYTYKHFTSTDNSFVYTVHAIKDNVEDY